VHFTSPCCGPNKLPVDDFRVIHQELFAGAQEIIGVVYPSIGDPQKGRQKDKEFKVIKTDGREEKLKEKM
jgi:hypothetical protein